LCAVTKLGDNCNKTDCSMWAAFIVGAWHPYYFCHDTTSSSHGVLNFYAVWFNKSLYKLRPPVPYSPRAQLKVLEIISVICFVSLQLVVKCPNTPTVYMYVCIKLNHVVLCSLASSSKNMNWNPELKSRRCPKRMNNRLAHWNWNPCWPWPLVQCAFLILITFSPLPFQFPCLLHPVGNCKLPDYLFVLPKE